MFSFINAPARQVSEVDFMNFVMHLDCKLQKIEVQCQHFFSRVNMIVTEMFVISFDLS